MAYYVFLANFTDQGVRAVRETPKRAEAFKGMAEKLGAKVHVLLWTLGKHDVVTIIEAPDDLTATALSLSVSELGNVKTQTLKAFDANDLRQIIGKMG
ncbi:MAG: GYD family protein [Mesorhizobium sp. SCN 65-20]|nr:MAG: GYD family protein [Mesorhizobium sp. SCN 65-20]